MSHFSRRRSQRKLIKPPRLREGDLIGLIAPGGHTSDTAIDKAVEKSIEDKTAVAMKAALSAFATVSPELADLLTGEEVTLEIKFRLKQKDEV